MKKWFGDNKFDVHDNLQNITWTLLTTYLEKCFAVIWVSEWLSTYRVAFIIKAVLCNSNIVNCVNTWFDTHI